MTTSYVEPSLQIFRNKYFDRQVSVLNPRTVELCISSAYSLYIASLKVEYPIPRSATQL